MDDNNPSETKTPPGWPSIIGPLHTPIEHSPDDGPRNLEAELQGIANDRTNELEQLNTMLREELARCSRTQEALRESEERYRVAIECGNDGVAILREGTIIYANNSFAEMFGWASAEESRGTNLLETVHPDDREKIMDRYRARLDGQPVSSSYEAKGIKRDGTSFFLEVSDSIISHHGETLVIGFLRDITSRKQAEGALREKQGQLATLIERSPVALAVYDAKSTAITTLNKCFVELFGYTMSDIPTIEHCWPLAFPDEGLRTQAKAAFTEDLSRAMAEQRETGVLENVVTCKDGSTRYIQWKIAPITGGAIVSAVDLTERRRVEAALCTSEEKFRSLVESLNEGIAVIQDGTIRYLNRRALEWSGYQAEELISKSYLAMVHPDNRQAATELYARRLRGEAPEVVVYKASRKMGEPRWCELKTAPTIWEGKPAHLYIASDITERKKAEKALVRSESNYRNLVENSLVGVYKTDVSGKILYANEALSRLLEYSSTEEVMSITAHDAWASHADRKALLKKLKRMKGTYSGDARLVTKTGRAVDTLFSVKMEGNILSGMVADITALKQMERDITAKSTKLEEMNAALRVLLEQREKDRTETGEIVAHNVKELVLPYIENLNSTYLTPHQKTLIDLIERSLNNIVSPFVKNMHRHYVRFTPSELKVANFIREGKTVKEISGILGVSESAAHLHSQHIRNKLGLKTKKVNLRTYLQSIEEEQTS